jgi:NADPH:quinone reductase-like Zn-dependent oxidoreductase
MSTTPHVSGTTGSGRDFATDPEPADAGDPGRARPDTRDRDTSAIGTRRGHHRGDVAATGASTMRALVQDAYGSPDVLRVASAPLPTPEAGQVRVRVAAASVNARDWHIMRGEPRLARLLDRTVFGRSAPRVTIRGTDFAGTVDAVGAGVTRWQPGDPVFGEADAALAEYVVTSQELVAQVPAGASLPQAAALPLAASTALMCLRAGHPVPGARLLINGASGGVGTFAIQLATTMGLHVTAVCSARNADLARSLGADAVIDYNVEDFCAAPDRYDMVLDLVGNRSVRDLRRLVHPSGTLILSGGGVSGEGRWVGPLGLLVRAQLLALLPGPRIITPQAVPSTERLEELAGLVAAGSVTPVVDRVFDLDHGADALRYLETEHARAKVIVTIPGT